MAILTWLGRCLLVSSLLLPLGCNGKANPLVPVSGKVTYKGVAVHQGTIVFTPDRARGATGEMAMADINRDGSYSLRTGNAFGAAPGPYRVTLAALIADGGNPSGHSYRPPGVLLPEEYRDPSLSKLACEVKADVANVLDFPLP